MLSEISSAGGVETEDEKEDISEFDSLLKDDGDNGELVKDWKAIGFAGVCCDVDV